MKTVESRTASNTIMRKSNPFFSKGSDQQFTVQDSKEKPFFPGSADHPSSIQTKLNIGSPNDPYEKEADSTADKVVQRMAETVSTQANLVSPVNSTSCVQKKCDSCEQEEKLQKKEDKDLSGPGKKIQRKPIFESNAEPVEEGNQVQKKEATTTSSVSTTGIESSLKNSKGSGENLHETTRQQMESSIGADFSNVRIHNDEKAARMSSDLSAQAFTHGNDIYFNAGKYNTNTREGQHLLAHELTHTVQQGKASASSAKNAISKSEDVPSVQRAPDSTTNDPPASKIPGPPYKKDGYELETKNGIMVLTVPKVSLPAFKERNKPKFIFPAAFAAGRIDSNQIPKWNEDVKTDVETNTQTFLNGKPKALNSGIYYFKTGKNDHAASGKAQTLKGDFRIPDWDRTGGPAPHSVDHIVELQLGGGDGPENYELLESIANSTIGSVLQKEIYKRIQDGRKFFTDNNVPGVPSFKDLTQKDSPVALVYFTAVDQWNLKPSKGNPDAYWSKSEVRSGFPLQQLVPMTLEEVHKLAGSDKNLHLFAKANSGKPHSIELPAKKQVNWIPGIDLLGVNVTNSSAPDDAVMGNISIALQADLAKKLNSPSDITINFTKIPGLLNAGALVLTGLPDTLAGLFKFKGLSPIKLNSFDISDNGLMITGVITADNPLIKDASIDFSITGKEIAFSKTFTSGEIKGFPAPFRLTDINLTIFASTEFGFGLSGGIDFEIKDFGKGSIQGKGASGEGFVLTGDFTFDKSSFNGAIHVTYKRGMDDDEGAWSFKGKLALAKNKIKGVESLSIDISSEKDKIIGAGTAHLTIKALKEISLTVELSKGGDLSIEGKLDFSKIPKLESANAKIILTKVSGEWDIAFVGEIRPKVNLEGFSVDEIKLDYHKGIFDISAKGHFKKGKLHGDFDMGITNKPVKESKKEETETPGSDLSFYASGSLSITIVEGVEGTIKLKIKPDGDILIAGSVELTDDKYIVNPKEENMKSNESLKIFSVDKSIPIASCGVASILLGLVGGVGLFYAFDGLKIDKSSKIELKEISLSNLAQISLSSEISMSTGISAGVEAYIGATASLEVLIAGIRGIGKINLKFTAVEIKTTAKVGADFSIDKGIQFKTAKLALDIFSKLSYGIELGVELYLDLLFGKVTLWDHSWKPEGLQGEKAFPLFDGELNISLNFGDNNAMSFEDIVKGVRAPLEKKAKNEDTYVKGSNRAVNNDGPSEAEKTEESKQDIRKYLKDAYRGTQSASVFAFNQTIDAPYFERRLDVWNRIHTIQNLDIKLIQVFEEEIKRYEFEEYEAFGDFLTKDTYFDANAQNILIEDFLKYRLTLGATERANLKSLVKKAKPNQKGKSDKSDQPPLQRSTAFESEKEEPVTGKPLHIQGNNNGSDEDNFHQNLEKSKGNGTMLPDPLRANMEAKMDADFSKVRIHNDLVSHQLNKQINAQAFTRGTDIFFNAGKYDTTSKQGQHLLAHELTHVVQQDENTGTEKIHRKSAAKTKVDRKTQADIFGVGILGGMNLSDFKEYTSEQADWFTEATLTAADRDVLWKLLNKTRPGSPIMSGVGDLHLAELRTVTDPTWVDLGYYARGCDSAGKTVRLKPSGLLAERIALGAVLRALEFALPGIVLEATVSEIQLKRILSDSLLGPLLAYLLIFKPQLQETVGSASALKGTDKSETQLLLDFVKAPGYIPFLPLMGRVRNLHRFAPDALMQLKANYGDFSHSKPVYLILYSGHDHNAAFIRSHTLFENLLKDKSKLVLMLEGQGSLQDIIDKVPVIAKDYGQPDAGKINRIAEVMIAGHGSSRSVEMAGTGNPTISGEGEVLYDSQESLDLDKNHDKTVELLKILVKNMNPATARVIFAGCLVGAKEIPVKNKKNKPLKAADIKKEVNDPGRKSLATTTADIAAGEKMPGMVVEGARASVALADSASLEDAAGNLHVDYTFDPTAFGNANTYVATGREPEGVMRSAVELAATNPIVAANQLRIRSAVAAADTWYDPVTLVFVKEALHGVAPGAGVDIVKVNKLATMADYFLSAYWASSSVAFFAADVNENRTIATRLYSDILALPAMTAPGDLKTKEGRFILELAWSMMTAARSAQVIAYLDGRPELTPDNLAKHLVLDWLNSVKASAHLFPPASSFSTGRIRLALAWMNVDNSDASVKFFLRRLVDSAGSRPRLQPIVIAQLSNPADEDVILDALDRKVPMAASAPKANADVIPDGFGPQWNETRIEPEIYVATVIAPVTNLNIRRRPSFSGIVFHVLKRGDTIQVMGFIKEWAAVDFNGELGFVFKKFISTPTA